MIVTLHWFDLTLAAGFVLLLAAVSHWAKLQVSQTLLIAALRCTIQLGLIGFILKWLFASQSLWLLMVIGAVMLLAAGYEVTRRQSKPLRGYYGFFNGMLSMLLSSFTLTIVALTVLIDLDPWYQPQYAIPLLGMMLGNTMTGVSLCTDRLTSLVWERRPIIEQRLMLGQTANEVVAPIMREAARAGMIPIINAMAAAGLVSLPGMMTGQILSGTAPQEAVKYQLLIMFLISAGTGLGVVASLLLTRKRLFDERQHLRVDRLRD